jgi:ankyrin repeat protein
VLQFAVQEFMYDGDNSIAMVKALTKDNRITQRDILGSCLSFAVGLGFISIVQLLLEAGADPDYYRGEDDYCLTPLIGTIFENEEHENHPEIARMLVAAGANLGHIGRSGTALDYAEDYEREDMIAVLRELQGGDGVA